MACRLKVVLVLYVVDVAVLAVRLNDYLLLEALREVVERIAHALHRRGLLKPLLHLLRVGLHLLREVAIEHLVLLGRVCSGAVEAFLHDGESVEHL